MSVEAVSWSYTVRGLSASERLVLMVLADGANQDTWDCWPSLGTISVRVEQSRSTVIRALKSLGEKGLIRSAPRWVDDPRKPGQARQTSSLYTLNVWGRVWDVSPSQPKSVNLTLLLDKAKQSDEDDTAEKSVDNAELECHSYDTGEGVIAMTPQEPSEGTTKPSQAECTERARDADGVAWRGVDEDSQPPDPSTIASVLAPAGEDAPSGTDPPTAPEMVVECLPDGWVEHLSRSGLTHVGAGLVRVLVARTPAEVRMILESEPLPVEVRNWAGLIRSRIDDIPAVRVSRPSPSMTVTVPLEPVVDPPGPQAAWVGVWRAACRAAEEHDTPRPPNPISPDFGAWLSNHTTPAIAATWTTPPPVETTTAPPGRMSSLTDKEKNNEE